MICAVLDALTELNQKYEDNKFGELHKKSNLNENNIALKNRVEKALEIINEIKLTSMSDSPEAL